MASFNTKFECGLKVEIFDRFLSGIRSIVPIAIPVRYIAGHGAIL